MTESKLPEISDKSIHNEKIRLRDFSRRQSSDGNFRSSEMKIKRMDIKSMKVDISNSPFSGEIQNQKKMSIGIRVNNINYELYKTTPSMDHQRSIVRFAKVIVSVPLIYDPYLRRKN